MAPTVEIRQNNNKTIAKNVQPKVQTKVQPKNTQIPPVVQNYQEEPL